MAEVLEDRLLTIRETGAKLDCSNVTVYKLINTGQLASLKIGRNRRIPASSVAAFITARTAPPFTDEQKARLRALLTDGRAPSGEVGRGGSA